MYVVSYMVELENFHCHVIITSISGRYSGLLVPLTDELHNENILEVVGLCVITTFSDLVYSTCALDS